jgi:hypothetical protein
VRPGPWRAFRAVVGALRSGRSQLPIREQGKEFLPRPSTMFDLDQAVGWPEPVAFLDTVPVPGPTTELAADVVAGPAAGLDVAGDAHPGPGPSVPGAAAGHHTYVDQSTETGLDPAGPAGPVAGTGLGAGAEAGFEAGLGGDGSWI